MHGNNIDQQGIYLFDNTGKLITIFATDYEGRIELSPDEKCICIIINDIKVSYWITHIMYIYSSHDYKPILGGNVYNGEKIFWNGNSIICINANYVEEIDLVTKKFFIKYIVDDKTKEIHLLDFNDGKIFIRVDCYNGVDSDKIINTRYELIKIE
jgi:hypothetical protein